MVEEQTIKMAGKRAKTDFVSSEDMHLIMLKYNGNLPSTDNTAMLVVLICTPGMNLQNFKFIFSHNDPE
jgi:hypothetical protein